jgi:hypothetical protein
MQNQNHGSLHQKLPMALISCTAHKESVSFAYLQKEQNKTGLLKTSKNTNDQFSCPVLFYKQRRISKNRILPILVVLL